MTNQQLDAGTPVYDADGRWIGIVSVHNVPGPHLTVEQGRWFPKEIYLPTDAIAQADSVGIALRLSRGDLKRYSRPPGQGMAVMEAQQRDVRGRGDAATAGDAVAAGRAPVVKPERRFS